MSRKIIQISAIGREGSGFFALCDDGTVWERVYEPEQWVRHPDIPQDEPTKEEPAKEEKPKMMRCNKAEECPIKCFHGKNHGLLVSCKGNCGKEGRKCVEVSL